jgi:hypothetical protein
MFLLLINFGSTQKFRLHVLYFQCSAGHSQARAAGIVQLILTDGWRLRGIIEFRWNSCLHQLRSVAQVFVKIAIKSASVLLIGRIRGQCGITDLSVISSG